MTASGIADAARTSHGWVRCSFACDDLPDGLRVHGLELVEELGRPYRMTVRVSSTDEATDLGDLLGRDVRIGIERGDHVRHVVGIVSRLVLEDNGPLRPTSTVCVEPALAALALSRNTRIFQDSTAVQIMQDVLTSALGVYGRAIDAEALAAGAYAEREFCVQYQETDLDFVHRLMEEEGIGYYFVHAERERLVLFDQSSSLPRVSTMTGAAVPFERSRLNVAHVEPVLDFRPGSRLRPTALTVRDHDWTRARPRIERTSGDAAHGVLKRHEVYEHGFERHLTITEDQEVLSTLLGIAEGAVRAALAPAGLEDWVQELPGPLFDAFTREDSEHQLRARHELLRRDARVGVGTSLVTAFSAGAHFELIGHPTLGADGEYLITKVTHTSRDRDPDRADAGEGEDDGYSNTFECIPKGVAWRPERRTRKPRIYGVQTARVTGPVGMDVYTDPHGRIRVKFHWDRSQDDLRGNDSCWMRVSQLWAGHGFPGAVFLPRVGMEVVVAFVEGDPDRPLVTGCVFNGANPTTNMLPLQATKSIIKTRTVPHGPGYNELSFEDAMGKERVHIRAQRDLSEEVLHDHTTQVHKDQTNDVGGHQMEQVRGDQRLRVGRHREKLVAADERETTLGNHEHTIQGTARLSVAQGYEQTVTEGSMLTQVMRGEHVIESGGRLSLNQSTENFISMTSEGEDPGILLDGHGSTIYITRDKIEVKVGGSSIVITPSAIQVNQKTFPAPPSSSTP